VQNENKPQNKIFLLQNRAARRRLSERANRKAGHRARQMTTTDKHRPITRALARSMAAEESESSDNERSDSGGAPHTPKVSPIDTDNAPGAPTRRRLKRVRYAVAPDDDIGHESDDPEQAEYERERHRRVVRQLFPAQEVAQGYVALMAIFTLTLALIWSWTRPLRNHTLPDPLQELAPDTLALSLFVAFAIGLVFSAGKPLVPSAGGPTPEVDECDD
jgi:hypothetical protein